MATWQHIAATTGIKMFFYPAGNIYAMHLNQEKHIKNVEVVCLMRDFDKELFYGQFRGELFAHCKQMKVVNAAPMYAQALTNLLHWAVENLPDDETVLVPAQGGGTYSYWSNPESAVLAKISLT